MLRRWGGRVEGEIRGRVGVVVVGLLGGDLSVVVGASRDAAYRSARAGLGCGWKSSMRAMRSL